jgi:hypothetical protein
VDIQINAFMKILKLVMMEQSSKLIRQPSDFPQRGKSACSLTRSLLRGTTPARFWTGSTSACLIDFESVTEIRILTRFHNLFEWGQKNAKNQ